MEVLIFWLAVLGAYIWLTAICVQKGKGWMAVCGWILFTPLLLIGAIRIAKPTSSWYARYEREPWKMAASQTRFPKQAYELELRKQLTAAEPTS